MPNFPQPPDNEDYSTDPWTDGNGQQWTYNAAKNRWHPYSAAGGGVSTFAELTDKESATIATTNTSVADALALLAPKASPTFTGTVTIPSGASISGYLTSATAASTYQPTLTNYSTISGLTGYPSTFAPSSHTHAASEVTGTALVEADATEAPTASKLVKRDSSSKLYAKGLILHNTDGLTTGIIPAEGGQGENVTLPLAGVGAYITLTNQADGKANLTTGAAGILPKANGGTGVSSLGATGASLMQAATTTAAWTTLGGTGTAASPTFTDATFPTRSNNSQVKAGTVEVQGFALNNSWIGENSYFDGGSFRHRATGAAGLFYFKGNEGQFRFKASQSAGAGWTGSGSNAQFKVNSDGTVSLGGAISENNGVTTGATLVANNSGVAVTGTLAVTGSSSLTGGYLLGELTVATLPTASTNTRRRYEVTDSLTPSLGATVAAGGSARCTVRSNGTNWIVTELL